jgi:isopenicillin-N epimerase
MLGPMRPYGPDSPWRFAPGLTYLTHGTFGATPVPILELQRELVDELEGDPIQILYREFETRRDQARADISHFVGADPEGVVVVPNVTTAVSTVIRSLRLRPGDEILTDDHEYNAVLNAIRLAANDAKARIVVAPIPLPIRHSEEVVEALLAKVTPHTRLAVISHVTSPTGLVLPIEAIVRELDRLGVDTLVDAAHAAGQVAVDVERLGAAYWSTNGHKWLCGPKVSGVLAIRSDRRHGIRPLVTSHGWNDQRTDRHALWREFDWQGTTDPTPFLVLPDAIRLVGALDPGGWPGLMAANRAFALAARRRLEAHLSVEPIAPESMVASMAAVTVPGVATEAAMLELLASLHDEDHVEVAFTTWPVPGARAQPADPPKRVLVRVSGQRYNEPADVDRLIEVLAARRLGAAAGAQASAIVGG